MELEPAEQRVILVGRTLEDGFYVERIEVSGMNIAVYYRGGDKSWFVVWATDKNGVRTGVPSWPRSPFWERPSPWNKEEDTAGNKSLRDGFL